MTFLADLDIEKHGLGHPAEKRPVDFTPDEIEQALDAFDKEDMAPPVFDANVHPDRIDELLSRCIAGTAANAVCRIQGIHPILVLRLSKTS